MIFVDGTTYEAGRWNYLEPDAASFPHNIHQISQRNPHNHRSEIHTSSYHIRPATVMRYLNHHRAVSYREQVLSLEEIFILQSSCFSMLDPGSGVSGRAQ